MLKIINDLPGNILGIEGEGEVTGSDYETVLIPAVEEKLKTNKKIRLLYHLGKNFTGFDLKAMIDDADIGLKDLTDWERIALVSDHEVINIFSKFFGYLLSGKVKIFQDSGYEAAKKWIAEK
ncbi:MAG: STAS/SEC14 domain-containing protein [Mucilaginibacter sp.]|jgi:hypothetical protein